MAVRDGDHGCGKRRMPKLLAALAITIVATLAICLGFASLAAWGPGRAGRSVGGDLPRSLKPLHGREPTNLVLAEACRGRQRS